MAMDHAWGDPNPLSFEMRLGTNDCDSTIGEFCVATSRGCSLHTLPSSGVVRAFAYNATIVVHVPTGQRFPVRVVKEAADQETRLLHGWRDICHEFGLVPGHAAVFKKQNASQDDRTFIAFFRDADGKLRRSRSGARDDDPPSSSPEFQGSWINVPNLSAQGAEAARGCRQAAGAGGGGRGGGERAVQRDGNDMMTIKEAMDLAVECGAREGSDEHYVATRLFVRAENRAMFLTFSTNAGRLQWLRRCYEDRMN